MIDNKELLKYAELANSVYFNSIVEYYDTKILYNFSDNALNIGLSGTDSSADVINDLQAFPNIKGEHSGFADRAEELLLPIQNIIDTFAQQRRDININFVGHSQGAGIAQILSKRLSPIYKHIRVISFGSPKVFLMGINGCVNHVRVWHNDDPVVVVPTFPYKHKDTISVPIGKDEFGFDICDHLIENYIKFLSK